MFQSLCAKSDKLRCLEQFEKFRNLEKFLLQKSIAVWQGVAMDSLKFDPGLPCPTLLCPVGGPYAE
jgi:hypothetical protein